MAIRWTPDLAVGIPIVDQQHQELFNRVNLLLSASAQGKGKDEIAYLVDFLDSYVVIHFRSEEGEMAKSNYPALAAHKQLHAAFIEDFGALKNEFKEKGASTLLLLQVQRRVVDWLLHHIGKEDKAFGAYVARGA